MELGKELGNQQGTLAGRLLGPDGITARQTWFLRRDLTREVSDQLPPGTPVTAAALETLTGWLLEHPDTVRLDTPAANGEAQWTSSDLLATEQRALAHADRLLPHRPVHPDHAADLVFPSHLTGEQLHAAVNLAVSRAAVQVLIGPAGSGKTTVLGTAATRWHASGRPVLGAALAAATADRLHAATGIPSESLARLLAGADRTDPTTRRPTGLPAGVVVVIDEASMVGTRQLTRLLDHVQRAAGSTVLVGDPAQLPEIDAGGLFTAFAQHPTTQTLTGNTRQSHDWERTALTALRAGDVDAALDHYLEHDRVHILATPDALADRIAADYTSSRARHGTYGVVALASRRTDVTRLNQTIRARLQTDGTISRDTITINASGPASTRLAVGDLVMITRNDPGTGLRNGTRAQLTAADHKNLTLRTEDDRQVTVPTGWASGRLTHAYAMTVHKAQGLTTQHCLLYGTSALCQQAGYVALSRGREANHIYTTLQSFDTDRESNQPGFQLLNGPDPTHVLDALTDRLTRSHTHTLATHQQPLPDREAGRPLVPVPADRAYAIER